MKTTLIAYLSMLAEIGSFPLFYALIYDAQNLILMWMGGRAHTVKKIVAYVITYIIV